jgi:hypothetical protein
LPSEAEPKTLGGGIEHQHAFGHNFFADAVAWDHCDVEGPDGQGFYPYL